MKERISIIILLFILWPVFSMAQDSLTIPPEQTPRFDSLKLLYPFLALEKNQIRDDSLALRPFFQKLARLESGENEQVVVVHIGDSHVQAGFITQPVRNGLQEKYGNAGIGVMFPYRVAKSNGPPGYLSAADTPWLACRNAATRKILPTGISGFTLWSREPSPAFTIQFTSTELFGRGSSRLTIFHSSRDSCRTFSVLNEGNRIPYPVVDSSCDNTTTYLLNDHPEKIRIRGVQIEDSLRTTTFYGMNLVGENPGVVVHAIGVNGATYANYLESEHFVEQLALLRPDLIIVSLGTNEAANVKTFEAGAFTKSLDSLMNKIRASGIKSPVLLTTPPAIYKSYRKKRRTYYKPNPVAATVSQIILNYAVTHQMAGWDWYSIMGGATAMAKWKAKKMTDKRYIHFSSKGYGIQGMLLYEAINQLNVEYTNRRKREK